ncbi:phage tail tape measure protein [Micromonospora sp. WMMD1128]|uniref:phage tail tape measure protein n=1 Tax=Micromonospora sp. WMMD1128 TaxID=3015150 RepID=UPI00248B7937|nr:phage tail tape measure protein [Micromonospora sp. WMMD1128]WBB73228.1 phage tail tape measure protein [Micromonospora sp. WMMD1128]
MALRTVGVKLTAEISQYSRNMRQAGVDTKQLVSEMDKAAKAGHLDHVANQAGAVGLSLVGMAGYAVKSAADFEKAMSGVRAATHASTADIERLRGAALQAGKDTSFSATQAADGITELSKAGVSTADVLNGGLAGALDLAAAGQLDVGEAAETAASAMTQFRLSGDKVPHIADLLAAAAGKAQGSVHDMGFALQQSGLVAAQFGLSIEDTTGTLAAFASAGLTGSDAGTSFKTMLLALANPAKETKELMEDLGIEAYDAGGQFVGVTNLAEQLRTKLGGLTQAQRDAAMAQIFGSDAIRAANVLYQQGQDGIQDWIDKVNDQGFAAETARIQTDNLAGDVERLTGSLETLAIESGSGANGGLRTLVQALDGIVNGLAGMPPAVGNTITVLAGLGGATALLGAGWVKGRRAIAEFRTELESVGPAGERASRGLASTTKWAGRAAGAFAALQVAGMAIDAMVDDLNPQVDALALGLERWGSSGRLAGEAARLLGGNMDDLNVGLKFLADTDNDRRKFARWGQDLLEGLVPGLDQTNTSLTRTRERVTAMDQAFAQMVQGGKPDAAKAAFDRLAASQATYGVTVDELRKMFPQYAAALETTGAAAAEAVSPTSSLTGVTKEYKTSADAAAAAARGQRDALVDLSAKMTAEVDPVFGLLEAQGELTAAEKEAAKAVKEHGRNSDEAKEATRKLALAAIELQEKAGGLAGTFDGKMTPALRTTLQAAGLTDRQIANVAAQFRQAKADAEKYDGNYKANASAPGVTEADKQLKNAKGRADAFDGSYKAAVELVGYPMALDRLKRLSTYQQALKKGTIPANFQGPVQGKDYHAGGWTGPGAKYQPAGVVHADEFVIKKESRQQIEQRHPGLLDEMNATGQVAGYAGGGAVRWPYSTTAARARIPSRAEVADAVMPAFGAWPSSPSAQRGDSGVWRGILTMIRAAGIPFTFGNGYRPGDPLWHGSGRADDLMGYNQDRLATFFAGKRPLELIHRTISRDYAYTRGRNMGSFNEALMEAHRNHVHIAMANGGRIGEPVVGVGLNTGSSYSFAERGPEWVIPDGAVTGGASVTNVNVTVQVAPTANKAEVGREIADALGAYVDRGGRVRVKAGS